ncbi:MAG: glutaredoxin family protein [Oscillatoriales cyanobacterium SM2_2_1]|nr:glutaredoxin family protein [Oscillatoriales cyanobacterium SM2_2_1]
MHLIFYTKADCCLCEGLAAKLAQVRAIALDVEERDITTQSQWWERYQYEVPVLYVVVDGKERILPRLSPRASVDQLECHLLRFGSPRPTQS